MLISDITFAVDIFPKNTLVPLSGFQMEGQLQSPSRFLYMEKMMEKILKLEQLTGLRMTKEGLKEYLLTAIPDKTILKKFDLDRIKREGDKGEILTIPHFTEEGNIVEIQIGGEAKRKEIKYYDLYKQRKGSAKNSKSFN